MSEHLHHIRRRAWATSCLVSLGLALTIPTTAHAADTAPLERTRALIRGFLAVASPVAGKKLTRLQKQSNAKTFSTLDAFFDVSTLKTRPIARHKSKFTPAQAKRFGATFYPLLRLVAFPDSGAFLRRAKRTLKRGKTDLDIILHAEIEADDIETDITFHWKKVDGALRVRDVSFDGVSLMKSYSNQFGRIVAKHGAVGLLARLTKRLKEERHGRKGLLP